MTLGLNCCTVNGLNNFEVGFPSELPPTENSVRSDYPVCAMRTVSVYSGLKLTVNCTPSDTLHQYVIIHSLDTSAEKMCIAEVCVYEPRQYAITLALMQQ